MIRVTLYVNRQAVCSVCNTVCVCVCRYGFLFDKALLVCKKSRGESLDLKELIELQHYQLRDEPTGEKDSKKVAHLLSAHSVSSSAHTCTWRLIVCVYSGRTPSCWWICTVRAATICTLRRESWRRSGWSSLRWRCESIAHILSSQLQLVKYVLCGRNLICGVVLGPTCVQRTARLTVMTSRCTVLRTPPHVKPVRCSSGELHLFKSVVSLQSSWVNELLFSAQHTCCCN